ncbi:hypothetical protein KM043_015907 [Ampulex compressa]|nr:hypothetical protein KM043_015907 [Ampulex compressa]
MISAISEAWYKENQEVLQRCPTLPIASTSIIGTIGGRAIKINRQLYVETKIGEITTYQNMILVPQLITAVIIGMDILKNLRCCIDLDLGEIEMQKDKKRAKLVLVSRESYWEGNESSHIACQEIISNPELDKAE